MNVKGMEKDFSSQIYFRNSLSDEGDLQSRCNLSDTKFCVCIEVSMRTNAQNIKTFKFFQIITINID